MAKLYRTYPGNTQLLLENIEVAESFFSRGKGLLGRLNLEMQQGLWIKPCNNIHTFFMKFNIDCIFIDRQMHVTRVIHDVKPFRMLGPFWKSHSVIEASAGFAKNYNVNVGDQLYVVS